MPTIPFASASSTARSGFLVPEGASVPNSVALARRANEPENVVRWASFDRGGYLALVRARLDAFSSVYLPWLDATARPPPPLPPPGSPRSERLLGLPLDSRQLRPCHRSVDSAAR